MSTSMSFTTRSSKSYGPKTMSSKSIVVSGRSGLMSSPKKAHSVYGGSYGGGTRISSSYSVGGRGGFGGAYGGGYTGGYGGGFGGGYGGGYASGGLGASITVGGCFPGDFQQSEKSTMQNLNHRLATYLEKVRSLEAANSKLEKMIREYYETKGPIAQRDYSAYWITIKDLKDKIKNATVHNANILLQIDNSKLAADDFRMKFEHELMMRQCVEGDIANLQRLLSQTKMEIADLENMIKSLLEELEFMKKNHLEELAAMRSQLTGTVNVEVDAAPQQDLNKVLEEIRADYESVIQKHRRDQESWFKDKTTQLSKEVAINTETIQTSKSQMSDLRHTVQSLEIELQSQLSLRGSLENTLADTEARYSAMLASLQNQINMLESELSQMRASIEQQGHEYKVLLDIKSRLEQEIATYRSLLDNQDIVNPIQVGSLSSGGSFSISSGGSHVLSSGGSQNLMPGGPSVTIKQTTTSSQRSHR
ncbi:keratin, type I cytoskeletal 19-like [Triplophysa dalaica]|uniref:keratin, type I cytoskeletal 19-like n=1 Tax=Triplophysa dalaica TaxID=1582913 RepID=UPI0024DFE2C1|nr:keratin, type I cytoskeletal 19-like [Triplophysa dalaica]